MNDDDIGFMPATELGPMIRQKKISPVEAAAASAPYGVFDNAGQDCCARSRILVERSAFDRFMELLEPAVQGVRVGDPSADSTEMGPLISPGQLQTVRSFVPESASIAFQGSFPADNSSVSLWQEHWRFVQMCYFWMSHYQILMPNYVMRCGTI